MLRCVIAVLMISVTAHSETHLWVSTTGDFSNPESWSTGIGPEDWAPDDVVLFFEGEVAPYNLDHSKVRIKELSVWGKFTGSVGNSKEFLRIDAERTFFTGDFFHYAPPDTPGHRLVVVDAVNAWIDGHVSNLFVKRGGVAILGTVNELVVSEGYDPTEVFLEQRDRTPPSRIVLSGGRVWNHLDIPAGGIAIIADGELLQYGAIQEGANLTQTGGIVRYRSIYQMKPTSNVRLELIDGVFDVGTVLPFGCSSYALSGEVAAEYCCPYYLISDMNILDITLDPAPPTGWTACPLPSHVLGDLDGDHRVNLSDFAVMQNEWSK